MYRQPLLPRDGSPPGRKDADPCLAAIQGDIFTVFIKQFERCGEAVFLPGGSGGHAVLEDGRLARADGDGVLVAVRTDASLERCFEGNDDARGDLAAFPIGVRRTS